MIAVIDLGISNLESVLRAFRMVGADCRVVQNARDLKEAAIVLPGVGAFPDGMRSLQDKGLVEPIREAAAANVPILGICLGMQLLANESTEHGLTAGLGLVDARVERLHPTQSDYRVPNIGWCDVTRTRESVLFPNPSPASYYHVHSYHVLPQDSSIAAGTIDYSGELVVVSLQKRNIFGLQFHPEKSQDAGLAVLEAFVQFTQPVAEHA